MNKNKRMKNPNIIFILMDALRPDNLSCYNYKRKTSPNIDNLAKKGVLFENAFTSNNSTNKCALSILASRHILIDKKSFSYDKSELKSFFNSGGIFLQEILKEKGYETYYLHHIYGWRKIGFDYYFEDEPTVKFIRKIPYVSKIFKYALYHFGSKKLLNRIKFKRASEKATNKTIEVIKKSKGKNFFIEVHYNDTHTPYNYPPQFANKFVAKNKSEKFFKKISKNDKLFIKFCKENFHKNCEINDIRAKYDNAIAYNDYLISKIIKTLKQERLFDDTIIVFFSDHAESLNEHGIYVDHHGLYDISTHVPLIILAKELPKNKKIKSLVSLQDITPTILDLANINYNPFLFDGKSLFPLISGRKKKIRDSVIMEENIYLKKLAIRTEKYKYMESPTKKDAFCSRCNNFHQGVIELYDLEKDPNENVNIAKENPKLLMKMKLKLDKKIRDIKNINEKRRIKTVLSDSVKTK